MDIPKCNNTNILNIIHTSFNYFPHNVNANIDIDLKHKTINITIIEKPLGVCVVSERALLDPKGLGFNAYNPHFISIINNIKADLHSTLYKKYDMSFIIKINFKRRVFKKLKQLDRQIFMNHLSDVLSKDYNIKQPFYIPGITYLFDDSLGNILRKIGKYGDQEIICLVNKLGALTHTCALHRKELDKLDVKTKYYDSSDINDDFILSLLNKNYLTVVTQSKKQYSAVLDKK